MKRIELIEAATQVGAGTVLIFLSNLLVFPVLGIEASEHEDARTFFARVRKLIASYEDENVDKPCECTF